jgi:hypothetical protein
MKHETRNMKHTAAIMSLALAAGFTFNAHAAVSEKCQKALNPVYKSLSSKSASNSEIITLLEYSKAQCSFSSLKQGTRGNGDQ